MGHLLNNKFLYFCVFIGLALHIISINFSIGFYSDDEHFQILEITAYLLGINEVAINDPSGYYWEWEEKRRMRPWFQPFIYYKIISFLKIFFNDNPFFWTYVIRILSSFLGFLSIVYLFFTFRNIFFKKNVNFNYFLYFTFWFYPFLHSRTSSENLSLSLFIISICILYKLIEYKNYRENNILFSLGSFLMGLSMVAKFTTVFNAFPFFLWLLIFKFKFKRIVIFGSFILAALFFGLVIDYINWGSFKNTYYQFYYFNLSSGSMGRMRHFGESPWYYYFIGIITELGPVLSIFFIIGLIVFWIKNVKNLFTFLTLISFIVFSMIAHKEIRYMFPIYIFAPFFIAYFFEKFSIRYLSSLFKSLIILSNILFLILTLFTPANSKVGVYNYIYKNINTDQKIYYTTENPYLVNNMESFFYTKFLPSIDKIDKNTEISQSFWVVSNNYDDILIFKDKNCEIKYSTYPKKIIDINENWKRLKLNWYAVYCKY